MPALPPILPIRERFHYSRKLKRRFKNSDEEERPMIQRVALHAFSLQFADLDGQIIFIEAPYPKDFEVFLKVLEKYDS